MLSLWDNKFVKYTCVAMEASGSVEAAVMSDLGLMCLKLAYLSVCKQGPVNLITHLCTRLVKYLSVAEVARQEGTTTTEVRE